MGQSFNPISTANVPGMTPALNITAATRVKNAAGRIYKVGVIVAGSAAGTINDCATAGAAAASNALCGIPNTVGMYDVNVPFGTALVVVPGTGQTLAVFYR